MPELPEVETVTRALCPHLQGRCITKVITTTDKLRVPLDLNNLRKVCSLNIISISRRAKYILIEFDSLQTLVLHLGMTGSCRLEKVGYAILSHDRVLWYLDNGMVWIFHDPRKFGMVRVYSIECPGCLPSWLDELPPEPLTEEFSATHLSTVISHTKRAIKSVLMDAHKVTGLGNIYANESLFRARINPYAIACSLSKNQTKRLVKCIKEILNEAIIAGGTTISDFSSVDGSEGKFSADLQVYGRQGKKCLHCQGIIQKVKIGGRSTFYCPDCQI